jgi:hypothetical protein
MIIFSDKSVDYHELLPGTRLVVRTQDRSRSCRALFNLTSRHPLLAPRLN